MIKANLSWMDREVVQSLLSFLPSHNVCEHYLAPFFSFVLFYWNSSFFLLVLFDPFCFFFTRQQPLITLLLILYFKAFFKQIQLGFVNTWQTNLFVIPGRREREKEGRKQRRRVRDGGGFSSSETKLVLLVSLGLLGEEGSSSYLSKQHWAPVAGGLCVWIHLWSFRFPSLIFFIYFLLGLKGFQTRQKIVLLFTIHPVILIFSILSASSVVYSCCLSVCRTLRHFVINLDKRVTVHVIYHRIKLIIYCFLPSKCVRKCFSLFDITVNDHFISAEVLVRQNKLFECVTLDSGELWWALFTLNS